MNYLLLHIKMTIRSPRLRQSFIVYLLLSVFYFYLFSTKPGMIQAFPIRISFLTVLFGFFPITFNQFLYSAEASFFDHLMITPNFKKILRAKYLLYVFFVALSFCVSLFLFPLTWQSFMELTAVLVYAAGTISLFSFCSILFVDTKIELFGSLYKTFGNTQSAQALAMMLVYLLSTGLVVCVFWLFSPQIAIYFMLITGGIFILFRQKWFNYLHRCFFANKYEKMEIFRIQ